MAHKGLIQSFSLICLVTLEAYAQDGARRIVPSVNEPHRWALVIGNDDYPRVALKNATNDARSMQSALQNAGFTVSLALNTNLQTLDDSVLKFLGSVQPGDVALVYYSGHGMQIDGENYLIPVDFSAHTPAEAHYQAYSASKLLDLVQERGARLNILVLDACRDNPFRAARSAAGGLAAMDAGKGTYIAFATAPGKTASDNPSATNGLFTGYLVEELSQPGLSLDEVFNHVRAKVIEKSKGAQIPYSETGVVGSFVFRDPDREEERVRAEAANLEEELKQLRSEEALARQRQSQQETVRKQQEEAAVQARLDFQRKEEDRLAKEREQRQLQALTADAATTRNKAEEQRLAELRRQVEMQKAKTESLKRGTLSMDEARQQIASLNSQLLKIRETVEEARRRAYADLDASYQPARDDLKKSLEKDMFETTAEYKARLEGQKKQSSALEQKYQAERAAVAARYDGEFDTEANPYQTRLSDLKGGMYPVVPGSVQFQGYDADQGQMNVKIGETLFAFRISPPKAKGVYLRKGSIQALESLQGDNAELIDPLSKETVQGGRANVQVNPKDGLTYVWIPAGSFNMGCSPGDDECSTDETPSHNVSITNGFWLGQTPVTQRAWKQVIGANPSHFKGDSLPVEQVTWGEAKHYCEAIGGRLPTEAEWEYAARAGTLGARYGNLDLIAWYERNSESRTHDVGTKQPNPWKLYDMLGNVWQWTADWYSQQSANERVLRGGSWNSFPQFLRVSSRGRNEPGFRFYLYGLRCVGE